jgi:predicted Zn-ribbon and HTH transcriptional regulator
VFRKDLIDILTGRPMSLHELALLRDESPRDLEDDLQHLFRSLRDGPLCPVVTPARCRKCGFVFRHEKLRKPGKCPHCKALEDKR